MPVRKTIARSPVGPELARRPLSECPFRLSAAEKELLKDPGWIDEEEADLILALREEKKHGAAGGIDIRDFARQLGIRLKG
jgi:hypothetical protein